VSNAFINTKGDYMLELHDEILIEANSVAELERERIIKELKANEHIWRERVVLNGLIALINGGTNDRA
jgi:hypothetical protein